MSKYQTTIRAIRILKQQYGSGWDAINPESAARMRAQNRFKTGLDIARYTAAIMRRDMANYDADPSRYTQSLDCRPDSVVSMKKHVGATEGRYLYLSGEMSIARIKRMCELLREADARDLDSLFGQLDAADGAAKAAIQDKIDNFVTHVIPIIADIDADFVSAEATYSLAKQMIDAGACCIQLGNRRSDEEPFGRRHGKVTMPHEDFLTRIRAVRYAFLELEVDSGVIVARTDALEAGLTEQIITRKPGDLGDQYNSFLDLEDIAGEPRDDNVAIQHNGKLLSAKRLPGGLFQFREGTAEARCVLDCITSLQNGADLVSIGARTLHVSKIGALVQKIREVIPNAKLMCHDDSLFNQPLNYRQHVGKCMQAQGHSMSTYEGAHMMSARSDDSMLAKITDERILMSQVEAACEAGLFNRLISMPTYDSDGSSTHNLAWPC